MGVVDRIVEHAERLTGAERKVAEVLAADPQAIAFGTVAQVAVRAGTSGPSVVRLAVKLGYAGFVDLQSDVQQELARQLGPAHDRIRQRPPSDLLARVHAAELDNVEQSLRAVEEPAFAQTVSRLADRRRHVWVLAGDVMRPIGETLAVQLGQLRERVELLTGSEVTVSRRLAGLVDGDVVIAIDIRRYERWLVGIVQFAAQRAATVTALTDSPLSPLVGPAQEAFFFAARGVGPFDSLTGAMALSNALCAAVAVRLRPTATVRLDAIEEAWSSNEMLLAAPGERSPLTNALLTKHDVARVAGTAAVAVAPGERTGRDGTCVPKPDAVPDVRPAADGIAPAAVGHR